MLRLLLLRQRRKVLGRRVAIHGVVMAVTDGGLLDADERVSRLCVGLLDTLDATEYWAE